MSDFTVSTSCSTKLLSRIGTQPRSVEFVYELVGWERSRFQAALYELVQNGYVTVDRRAGEAFVRRNEPTDSLSKQADRIDTAAHSLHCLLKEKGNEWKDIQELHMEWLVLAERKDDSESTTLYIAALLLLVTRHIIDVSGDRVRPRKTEVQSD